MRSTRAPLIAGCLALAAAACAPAPQMEARRSWVDEREQRLQADGGTHELPPLDAAVALDDYVRFALRNNPGARAAFSRWRAAVERVAPAGSLGDPRFTYTYQLERVETRVGPQTQRLGLAQSLPWPGKLDLDGRIAATEAQAEAERYRAACNDLVLEVKRTYVELWYLERAAAATSASAQLAGQLEAAAQARYRSGTGAHGEVIRAQVELGRLQSEVSSLRDMRGPLAARLNAALGRPPDAPVAVAEELPGADLRPSADEALGLAATGNPELRVLDQVVQGRGLATERARKDYFPDVTLGLDYIPTMVAEAAVPESGKDPLMAMVSINLPLWRGRYRSGVDEARARTQQARHERRAAEQELSADLAMALYGVRDGERRSALYGESLLPRSEQALAAVRQSYRAGEAGFLDLVDAQRSLLEFQLALARARADRALSLASVEQLIGGWPSDVDPAEENDEASDE